MLDQHCTASRDLALQSCMHMACTRAHAAMQTVQVTDCLGIACSTSVLIFTADAIFFTISFTTLLIFMIRWELSTVQPAHDCDGRTHGR